MAVTYTNHKGKKYYLCCKFGKNGQKQYFFARRPTDNPVDAIPSGYEIRESETGHVTLAKDWKIAPAPSSTQKQSSTNKPTSRPAAENTRKTKPQNTADMKQCPVCSKLFPFPKLKWHIRDNHPQYTPAVAISVSIQNDPNHKHTVERKIRPKQSANEIAQEIRAKAVRIEQITCGWCYDTIYQVWMPSGRNKYYEDEELMTPHRCTRPVHWDLDRSGGPFES